MEKLTQEQIDALINGGEEAVEEAMAELEEVEKFQDYDFNRPDKFNVENIRSLKSIANVFSRGLSQSISASLRTNVSFRLNPKNSVEQVPYANEYIEKMVRDYYAFCVVDLGVKDLGKIIIEIDIALALGFHRNQLGSGKTLLIKRDHRSLTEIEKITLEQIVVEKIFPQLEEAFQNVAMFNLRLEKIETDPQYVKITRNVDMISLIGMDVDYQSPEGQKTIEMGLKIGIPYLSIESIMDRLTTENASEYRFDQDVENERDIVESHAKWIPKIVEVEIGKLNLTVNELLSMQENEVLQINRKLNENLIAYIDGIPKFGCKMGKSNGHVGVKIVDIAKREVLVNEREVVE